MTIHKARTSRGLKRTWCSFVKEIPGAKRSTRWLNVTCDACAKKAGFRDARHAGEIAANRVLNRFGMEVAP